MKKEIKKFGKLKLKKESILHKLKGGVVSCLGSDTHDVQSGVSATCQPIKRKIYNTEG